MAEFVGLLMMVYFCTEKLLIWKYLHKLPFPSKSWGYDVSDPEKISIVNMATAASSYLFILGRTFKTLQKTGACGRKVRSIKKKEERKLHGRGLSYRLKQQKQV